ncbi:MAG: porin family protein [Synechococcales cyanobacterium RM1_1_8]|nr:porin family protein [Synechococcales cyanobacterium RM1_1_8]
MDDSQGLSSAICAPPIIDLVYDIQPFSVSIDSSTGFGLSGAVGYRFNRNFRTELELGYNRNTINQLEVSDITINLSNDFAYPTLALPIPLSVTYPGFKADLDGKLETWTVMASGYCDIDTNRNFKPYLGGGIGIANLSASGINADIPGLNQRLELNDNSASFIFQVKAGAAYQISDRGLVSLGYRLQSLPGQSFEADGIEFDSQTVLTHAIEFGGQYQF